MFDTLSDRPTLIDGLRFNLTRTQGIGCEVLRLPFENPAMGL